MFDILHEKDRENPKYCPKMKVCGASEAKKLVSWRKLKKIVETTEDGDDTTSNANENGNAMVVVGYMKPLNEEKYQDKYMSYMRVYVMNTKGTQHIYVQHRPEKKYDLILFLTEKTLEGEPIEDIKEQVKGCIKVNGVLKEEYTDWTDSFTRRVRREFQEQLSVSSRKRIHFYSAGFCEE